MLGAVTNPLYTTWVPAVMGLVVGYTAARFTAWVDRIYDAADRMNRPPYDWAVEADQ